VTVPSNKIIEKQLQYSNPMDAGSIVVKDETEVWEAVNPDLHGADAGNDMKAVRGMIDAGSGYPPHWRGEAADANLATATAMQGPTERHLARRQKYFNFMLKDILYHSYKRAAEIGKVRQIKIEDYEDTFIVSSPDVSRTDNEALARAAKDLTQAFQTLAMQLPGRSPALERMMLKLFSRFAGEPITDTLLSQIMDEAEKNMNREDAKGPVQEPGQSAKEDKEEKKGRN
jgi:hypothetical protein